ncbi:acyltransferase family protein [Allobranchiibius huperziae]|uniref:Peptidoglycan/LPS O-acetylase OafA/YrhL n=1 Tax=Allobranchiibius huperziae TaxID=1874116 RepID=A0A853DDU6_9MICO|nr:acyltransferase family protein [Allobranchiibius huperziae]NYJ74817.1 peptidoglycan/LPS O-acetylase OafA/YrhL [Allobranchiibius huperziae]
MPRRTLYRYSPALDGVRGTAMVLFMAFHFGATFLQGAWVGINLFFVLSAYLITRLLIEERARFGRLDVLGFYRRRARRLLPGLVLLLVALGVYGTFIAPDEVRTPLRGDILATLFYVQNWHLILRHDQYFGVFNPSFLRHAWTLSVEEQFYLFVPLVVLALVRWARRREVQAAVLLVLALVSAVWTAHIGVATEAAQTHAYYGTDTRAQALCVGAALAFATGLRRHRSEQVRLSAPLVAVLGWGGLAAMIYAYPGVSSFQPFMYDDGGILLFALASAALVLACADGRRSLLRTVLGWRPFAYLGRISYGLYLWHWPVLLWLQRAHPGIGTAPTLLFGMSLTLALAAASYRFIERPVLRGGVRALIPSLRTARAVVAGALAAVVVLAFTAGAAPASGDGPVPMLVPGTPTYRPAATPTRVAIFGDSVPDLLVQQKRPGTYPDLRLTNLASPGCDLVDARYADRAVSVQPAQCTTTKRDLQTLLRRSGASELVVFGGLTLALPHAGPGGGAVGLDDASYRTSIDAALTAYRTAALAAGVRSVSVVTVPCREPDVSRWPTDFKPWFEHSQQTARQVTDPVALNALITEWAARNGAHVIDLYGALCGHGFQPELNGTTLYRDQVHFTSAAAPMIWTWLAPRIRAAAGASGTGA